mgnify:CR=1 FL=1
MSKIFKDRISILYNLSGQRIWNIILLQTSYLITRIINKPFHMGMPMSISIEPTTSCNLRCSECPSGLRKFSRNTGMLSMEMFKNVLDQLGGNLLYMILYFQGEPLINPKFFEFVKLAKQKRIYTATSTNAHFLTEENARKTVESGLNRLIISMDGIGQKEYEAYRVGGKYQKVLDGINSLVRIKKELKSSTPHIIVQFIVFKTNEHQLDSMKEFCKDLGVDELQFKTAQLYDYKNGNPLMTTIDKYSRYKKLADGTYTIKNPLHNRCYRMWTGCVITWDGLTVPCCFDKDAEYQLGELKVHSFKEIWKGELYDEFRKKVFTNRKGIDICINCTEGTNE